MEKNLYVAYGTELNRARMLYRCPTAKPIAKSWLFDHKLAFRGKSYGARATVIPAKGYDVPVVVWEISKEDEANLDRYKGVANGIHRKRLISVEVGGEMKEALIHIKTSDVCGCPTAEYLQAIRDGYGHFNLDLNILLDAVIRANQESIAKEEKQA